MIGWERGARRWLRTRRAGAVVTAAALVMGLWTAVPASTVSTTAAPPPVPNLVAAHGLGTLATHVTHPPNQAATVARPSGTTWPAASSATASLTGSRVRLGTTPVWARRATGSAADRVAVHVLGHRVAAAAGVPGVVFTARSQDHAGRVQLGVDYRGFAGSYGGNYAQSLGMVELPACALTTPAVAACRQRTPLPSVNDPSTRTVSTTVPLVNNMVLAVTPTSDSDGGPAGTYSATSLKPSATWAGGGSSGAFTYSYPITVPSAASTLVPSVSLDYDSGSVDGQTAATQAQSSWIGDGWSTQEAFIEQSFVPCSDSPEGTAAPASTADRCYSGPVLTLSLNGASTPLVCPSPFSYTVTSTCVPSNDDGAVVTHVVSSANGSGTKFTDYWTVAERDGTTYVFGRNQLPGFAAGDATTNSVDSEPVFSAHSGDPCFSTTSFAASVCTMAYRWNMDYVTDVHSNAMAFYYDQSTNAYAQDGATASAKSYVRDSHIDHIDYGFTAGNAYSAKAPDQVVFGTSDRCFVTGCGPLGSTTAVNWMDVPFADNCAAAKSCTVTGPTFWSTVRLTSIVTQQWNGTAYAKVDSWALAQHFPTTGDGTSPTLWLDSITRTGSDTTAGGAAVTLPPVTFTGVDLANRVNPGNFPALDRYRIADVTTESGSVIEAAYTQVKACSPTALPTAATNTSSCFPVFWQQFQPPTPDWFIKYAVSGVDQTDPTGGSPGVDTSYVYSGPAWHFDDNDVVSAKFRTYAQFRGYADVKTFTGTGLDTKTESETTYYQGMSNDNNTVAVNVTDSQGNAHADLLQLVGAPLETTQYNYSGGPIDNSTIDSYWVSPAVATRARTGLPALTANVVDQTEEWNRQAITDTSPATWRITETDTTLDATPTDADFGLPLYVFDHGDLSVPAQQTCTTTTYAAANTRLNLVGLAAEVEQDAGPCGGSNPSGASVPGTGQLNALTAPVTVSRPADVISDTRTYYDDPPVLTGGLPAPTVATWPQAAPANGDESVVQHASDYTAGAFTYLTTAATTYDSIGRPTTAYDAKGNRSTTSYTMTNSVLTGETATNALGQAMTTGYDPLRGLPTVATDANGIATMTHYDGLGRVIDMWLDGRATSTQANYIYSYAVSNSAPTVVTTQRLDEALGYVTTTTLYDALLRERQQQQPTPQNGRLIDDNFYDSRNWLVKVNTDYWDKSAGPGNAIVTVPDNQVTDQTVTAYDGLYRQVLVTSLDKSLVKSTTATAYYGDRVTTVPPTGGTPTSTVTDALGRTTETDQYTTQPTVTTGVANGATTVAITGGATQATTDAYNVRGENSDVRSAGEDWHTNYNLLGETTSSSNPNSGTTSETYDNDGNVAAATDAKGATVSFSYDALNRKTGEFDGTSSASPPIDTYAYDNSNNAVAGMTDPIGQLTTETSFDHGGSAYTSQQKGFNAFGESTGQTWTIPAAQGALAGMYTSAATYTPVNGLPLTTSYPASPAGGALPAETAQLTYTPGFDLPSGVRSTLGSYQVGTTYDTLSRPAVQELGSTTGSTALVTNTYDEHTGALSDTTVANSAVSATPMDDTSYIHDAFGNITSEVDNRSGTESEAQCYRFNTLDQLTEAWTGTDQCAADPAANSGATIGDAVPGSAYWTSWAFNAIGERTNQTQHSTTGGANTVTSYAYNTGQPNTLAGTSTTGPAGASSTSYSYDPDGNTVTRGVPGGAQTLTWNDDGSLAGDATTNGTTSYVYDADGNVLVQADSGTHQTTLYVFGEQIVLNTGTGAVTGTRFIPLVGNGEVVRTGASYDYELTDQQGTGVLTLSADLTGPAWRQSTPYGAARGTPPTAWPDTNGFLGKPTDSTTGLTIVGARQYDPSIGMFISVDPMLDLSNPQVLNGYSYGADNPITNSDPSGAMLPTGQCVGCPPSGRQVAKTSGSGHKSSSGTSNVTPSSGVKGDRGGIFDNLFGVSPAPAPKRHLAAADTRTPGCGILIRFAPCPGTHMPSGGSGLAGLGKHYKGFNQFVGIATTFACLATTPLGCLLASALASGLQYAAQGLGTHQWGGENAANLANGLITDAVGFGVGSIYNGVKLASTLKAADGLLPESEGIGSQLARLAGRDDAEDPTAPRDLLLAENPVSTDWGTHFRHATINPPVYVSRTLANLGMVGIEGTAGDSIAKIIMATGAQQ